MQYRATATSQDDDCVSVRWPQPVLYSAIRQQCWFERCEMIWRWRWGERVEREREKRAKSTRHLAIFMARKQILKNRQKMCVSFEIGIFGDLTYTIFCIVCYFVFSSLQMATQWWRRRMTAAASCWAIKKSCELIYFVSSMKNERKRKKSPSQWTKPFYFASGKERCA